MNVYFDTEFSGLHKNTQLISIGLVSDDDQQFYAEITDYNKDMLGDWVKENVLSKMIREMHSEDRYHVPGYHTGTKKDIAEALRNWLMQWTSVTFVSDVCHYDMILLIDLFGSAFDLPGHVCPACYDINQDIAAYFNITLKQAFDKSREEIVNDILNDPVDERMKHNALYDAHVIKKIYDGIHDKVYRGIHYETEEAVQRTPKPKRTFAEDY